MKKDRRKKLSSYVTRRSEGKEKSGDEIENEKL